jgi:hypothetical protein
MQWYVYLIAISAAVFLGRMATELVSPPLRTIFELRRKALERMLSFRNMPLPVSREFAVSSREIREHDQALRNLKEAQRTFGDLGAQMLALWESEPTIRGLMAFFGLDMALAGRELIYLSEIYATAKNDSNEIRRGIEQAFLNITTALAASRRLSGNDLTNIPVEPINFRQVRYHRMQNWPLGQPSRSSGHAGRIPRRSRQSMPAQTAHKAPSSRSSTYLSG